MNAFHRRLGLILLLLVPFGTASAQSPALSPIVDVTLNANTTATINVVAIDAGGGEILLSSALPSFGTLNSPSIGLGSVVTTFTLAPSDIHVGTYTAALVATAAGVSETELFQITVNPAGSAQAPLVMSPALREITAGEALNFTVDVSDPDGGGITDFEASMLPSGAVFAPNVSNTSATVTWTPDAADAGEYDVIFLATALNGLAGGAVTHIRVAGPPMLAIDPIDDVTVEGGSTLSVPVHASGLPGALISLTASLPSFATLNPPGSGTGAVSTTITLDPPTGSAGTYHASVTAISEGEFVTEPFDIIVTGTGGPENNPPFVSAPAFATVEIGSSLSFLVTATDPDGDHVDLFGSALPPGSAFTDHGDNTGTFSWIPVAGQQGTHFASFSGLDNRGGSGAATTQILVTGGVEENQVPTLSAPATQQVDEGVALSFLVTATDPDGDAVTLFADGLPSGATFTDNGNNTGSLSWIPDFSQSGSYEVAFMGNDGQGGSGTASTMITVIDIVVVGTCTITGDFSICAGQTTQLCGPENADSYSWSGPGGFTADSPCIDAGEGTYELTVVDAEGLTSSCSATVTVTPCDGHNCPRGPGFWMQQCAQRGNGSTKFTRAQMEQITACVDARSEFFDWSDDFEGFCAVVDPPRPMNIHKQTLRMYVVLLANVCTGELGLVANNGDRVSLDPNTGIDCGVEDANTIAELMAEAETRLAELDGLPLSSEVVSAYGPIKDCMDAISNGIGIGPTCSEGNSDAGDDEDNQAGGSESDEFRELQSAGFIAKVHPNPLNPMTQLSFSTSREGRVRVSIYDVQGRLVRTLLDEHRPIGDQSLVWDGSDADQRVVRSGVYFVHIQAPEGEATQKLTVLK